MLVSVAHAEDSGVLVNMLASARGFRVRSQAALALGRSHGAKYADALELALHDRHPLVRASAATALGELAGRSSLPALRVAANDDVSAVSKQARAAIAIIEHSRRAAGVEPAAERVAGTNGRVPPDVRYVLVVGAMHDDTGFSGNEPRRVLGASLWRELTELRRVAVLRADAAAPIADAVARGLPVLRLEGNVTQLVSEPNPDQVSVHCEVSLLVMDDAGRNLRTVLKGAATGLEPRTSEHPVRAVLVAQQRRIARNAVDGAVRSALRNASSAIENAAARADVTGKDTATAALPRARLH